MKKIFLVLLALFIIGCADDGKDGVDGVTGTGGCDFNQVFDEDLGFCIMNPNYVAPVNGAPGVKGDPGPTGGQGDHGDGLTGDQHFDFHADTTVTMCDLPYHNHDNSGVCRNDAGYDLAGYNVDGYGADGFNIQGFDINGLDRNGCTDVQSYSLDSNGDGSNIAACI